MVLEVGESAKLNITVRPKLTRIGTMVFFSEYSDIAEVDSNTGIVTGKRPGTTTVFMDASGVYGSDPFVVDKCCTVTVVEKGSSDQEKESATAEKGASNAAKESSSAGKKSSVAKPAAIKAGGVLIAKAAAKGKKKIVITWNKVTGADGYDIYLSRCNSKIGTNGMKLVKTVKAGSKLKYTKKGLKKKKTYKVIVKAYVTKDGKKTYIKTSPTSHVYTSGGTKKYTNAKAVKLKRANVTLRKGRHSRSRRRSRN